MAAVHLACPGLGRFLGSSDPLCFLSFPSSRAQFLKTSWMAALGRLSHDAPAISDADIEDAAVFRPQDHDEVMVDSHGEPEEPETPPAARRRTGPSAFDRRQPSPPSFSDDEYDDIFAELVSREQPSLPSRSQQSDERMDTSDDG